MYLIKTLKKISAVAVVSMSVVCASSAQTSSNGDGDDLLLTIPAIVTSKPRPVVQPVWTVVNEVCCSTGSAEYAVTIEGQRRASVLRSCSAEATVPDVAESTAGNKIVQSVLDARNCGRIPLPTFNFPFEESTVYVFQAVFNEGNGGIDVNVLSGALTASNALIVEQPESLKRFMKNSTKTLLKSYSQPLKKAGSQDSEAQFQAIKR